MNEATAPPPPPAKTPRRSLGHDLLRAEDWWAIWAAALLFALGWMNVVVPAAPADGTTATVAVQSRLRGWFAKPGSWQSDPRAAFITKSGDSLLGPILCTGGVLLAVFGCGVGVMGRPPVRFAAAFPGVFLLAAVAYLLAGQTVVKHYNLEYALWALLIGLLISNTIGTPQWLQPAVRTEFYIKTGLVLLGAEVLVHKLLALGPPGIAVAWVVTPVVLISTYIFGQKVLGIESRSLNMVICADMSVCGVSAAIATAAACRAKKEELSLAVGMSLTFTVVMMVVMPLVIRAVGMDEIVGGAWLGGTIDSTGAVAAAGAVLGKSALEVAATVKMIQNILIGVVAFGVAVYWTTCVDRDPGGAQPDVREIWYRFPKFVLGFVGASLLFSWLHSGSSAGSLRVEAMIDDVTKVLRDWCFCLAFVSIGLESRLEDHLPQLRGGKPLWLYLAGQSLNLVLTLLMAWLMFGVVFRDWIAAQVSGGGG